MDHLRIEARSEVFRLYQEEEITDAITGVISPLFKDDINSVAFRQGAQDLESVTKDEASYFRTGDDTTIYEVIIPRQELVVVSPNLGSSQYKWRLNDSSTTRLYSMNDKQFRENILNGTVRFGVEDILVCDVKVITRVRNRKTSIEFEVSKVFEHRSEKSQPLLF